MDKWVKSLRSLLAKQALKNEAVTVVLGNEACDLDSGVCALTLAYHLHIQEPSTPTFPVLNIQAKDYTLKTELVHCLEKINIREEDLIFRDTINLQEQGNLKLILVDHNILSAQDSELEGRVVEVLDHHVLERQQSSQTRMTVEMVGSCSSLVAEKIFSESPSYKEECSLRLLMGAIILDTVNLKPKAKKVTPKDIASVERIESALGAVDRSSLFDELWAAKGRFQHFTPNQLLRRDLKCVTSNKTRVGLSSVPLLVENFVKMEGVRDAVLEFGRDEALDVVLVLGYSVNQDEVTRDLLISDIKNPELHDEISKTLEEDDLLQLTLVPLAAENGNYYHQANVAASRKQILPIVKKVVCK